MKKYFTSIILCINISAMAQVQGTVIYERKVDVHRRLTDEQVKTMVPQYQTSRNQLIFSDDLSVYKALPEDNAPDPFESENAGNIQIRIGGPGQDVVLYKNYTKKQLLEQTQLSDKDYIINDSIHAVPWKMQEETKIILGHPCKKATMKTERGSDVTAWYATDIPVPAGPDRFDGLPGIILLADVNNGEMVFTATGIQQAADRKELKEPVKGKHLTRAEFNKKTDELFGPPTPDGRRIMRVDN